MTKKTIKLTESQLNSIIKGVIIEQDGGVPPNEPINSEVKKTTENILNAEHKVKSSLIKYLQALASNGQYPTMEQFHNIIDRYINYYIPTEIATIQAEKSNN